MKILVIGNTTLFQECRQRLGEHDYMHALSHADADKIDNDYSVIFDFAVGEDAASWGKYTSRTVTAFVNTSKDTLQLLKQRVQGKLHATLFGFNGLPTMFNRKYLEVSVMQQSDHLLLDQACKELNVEYLLVDDRVGMVTPRVICMIINEAYFTVQEGTASQTDIDLAMKVGTNYPYGPFEWCERIGLKNVYELLNALYEDTKDERYKICPLLKKEYLRLKR
jgi:3-hydroxybutyryl-CoA dehydrogenase